MYNICTALWVWKLLLKMSTEVECLRDGKALSRLREALVRRRDDAFGLEVNGSRFKINE